MWRFDQVRQYQFIQNDSNDYLLKINKQKEPFPQENEILKALKMYVGSDANIQVEYVDEIPLLASGKRKQVINNYKK